MVVIRMGISGTLVDEVGPLFTRVVWPIRYAIVDVAKLNLSHCNHVYSLLRIRLQSGHESMFLRKEKRPPVQRLKLDIDLQTC